MATTALPTDSANDAATEVAMNVASDPTGTGAQPAASPAPTQGISTAPTASTQDIQGGASGRNFAAPTTAPDRLDNEGAGGYAANPSPPQSSASPAPQQVASNAAGPWPRGPQGASGGGAVATSEPAPMTPKLQLGPERYIALKERNPHLGDLIDIAAQKVGVPPVDLANIAYVENRFKTGAGAATSEAGAIGPMQVMPATARMLDPTGKLDIHNDADNVLLGAMAYKQMADRYGVTSPSAFAGYFAGPGEVDAAAKMDQATAQGRFPKMFDYINAIRSPDVEGTGGGGSSNPRALQLASAGASDSDEPIQLTGSGSMTPQGIIRSATQGGPQGFMQYMVQNGPQGMGMTDLWRHAEASLVSSFILKGDMEGAQHARDFILQLSHAGSNMNLMAAHQALARGDGVAAANLLAQAHAFFPDGTMGRFRTNGQQVWAERLDENNPSQRIGDPMQVTPDGIASLLNQTTNPAQYLQTLSAQQKTAADVAHLNAMSNYYGSLPEERREAAETRANAVMTAAQTHANATETAAQARANAMTTAAQIRADAMGAKPDLARARAVEKETNTNYDPSMAPDQSDEGRMAFAKEGGLYQALRNENVSGPQAKVLAEGLNSGALGMRPLADGRIGVVDKGGNALVYLPQSILGRLGMGGQQSAQPQSPVGAGATSMYARGAGVSSNLTGTVTPQPAAAPQQPQQ